MQQTSSSKPFWSKLSSSRKVIVLLFCVLFIISLGIFFVLQNVFTLKTITIDKSTDGPDILGIESFKDTNILFLQEQKVSHDLYTANPLVKSVQIEKKLPDAVIVHVTYSQPLAYLKVDDGFFLLSEEGRIMKKIKEAPSDLPIIHYYQLLHYTSYSSGDTISYIDITRSLGFLKKAKELELSINSVDITGFNMIALNTAKQQKLLFTLEKKQSDQEYQFERVVQQLKIEGKQYKTLDFRFDRVIIGT